jgi:hypothetical protein
MNLFHAKLIKIFCLISLFARGSWRVFAETTASGTTDTTPVPYEKDEFPQWADNLRRTEIISFGSLPFVTLGTTLFYSLYRYYYHGFSSSYIPNPFAKSSDSANLDTGEQMMIIRNAAIISVGLGLTDLAINLIRQKNREKKEHMAIINNPIIIEPLDDRSASADRGPPLEYDESHEYLYGGMQSAIF